MGELGASGGDGMTQRMRSLTRQLLDTWTVLSGLNPGLARWLGDDLLDVRGDTDRWVYVRTPDRYVWAGPGWVLVRHTDGALTVFSPSAARHLFPSLKEVDHEDGTEA